MASTEYGTHADGIGLGVLSTLIGYHLRRASGRFAADFTRALAGTGMRQILFGVLSVVACNPGISQGSVGRALGIKRANMVTLINQLVDEGLIERQVAATDRRAFNLTLTAAGQRSLDHCLTLIHEHERAMLGRLSADEREILVALLARIEPATL